MEIFICGSGRSGTSIFNKILGTHRDIWSFRWESQIFSGLPALVDIVDTRSPNDLTEKFIDRAKKHLFKRNVGRGYDAGLFEIISYEDFSELLEQMRLGISKNSSQEERIKYCREFSDNLFAKAALKDGKRNWSEKTPRNLLYADKIQRIYPDAKFINVIRDGREVVSSILEKKFWPMARSSRFPVTMEIGGEVSLDKAVLYWCNAMNIAQEMKERVGPQNWLTVRLEDLGSRLDSVQIELESFLGVEHDSHFIDSAAVLLNPKRANRKRWRENKSKKEIERINKSMEGLLLNNGYEL